MENMRVLNWLCVVAKSTYLEFCPDTGLSEFMTQLGGMSHFTSLQWDFSNIDIYILGRCPKLFYWNYVIYMVTYMVFDHFQAYKFSMKSVKNSILADSWAEGKL